MSRRTKSLALTLLVLGAVISASCASSDDSGEFNEVGSAVEGADDAATGWDAELPEAAPDGGIYLDSDERGTDLTTPPPGEGLEPGVPVDGGEPVVAPTAGSVDDNELWDDYLLFRDEFFAKGIPVSDIPVDGRRIISVVDVDGDPVLGAELTITDPEAEATTRLRTHADGRAVFLAGTGVDPSSQSSPTYLVDVAVAGSSSRFELEPGALTHTLELDVDVPTPAQLDVLFLVDATGSMGDEIERLKASMISVSEQIAALPADPDTRFSMVVYRDREDEYLTRTFDFTSDVGAFTEALTEVAADGGGDTPEALGSGLDEAVSGVSWRGEGTVQLVFLVADAAPHLAGEPGYEEEPDYAAALREAAAAGIKVFPIASSGLDAQGEFVFRQLAQVTMGRFVFLTYGTDGRSPGTETPHDVDPSDYDVLALDALVVQLVSDELAGLPR